MACSNRRSSKASKLVALQHTSSISAAMTSADAMGFSGSVLWMREDSSLMEAAVSFLECLEEEDMAAVKLILIRTRIDQD